MHQFKLEKLLNYRKWIEETKEGELAKVSNRLRVVREQLDACRELEERYRSELTGKLSAGIIVSEEELYNIFLGQLKIKIRDRERVAKEIESQVEQKRQELVACLRDRKLLEKLKEKEDFAFKTSTLEKEQKFMSEVALTRFNRDNKQ